MAELAQMATDPEYLALPPEKQAGLRQEALGVMIVDPDFQQVMKASPEKAVGLLKEFDTKLTPQTSLWEQINKPMTGYTSEQIGEDILAKTEPLRTTEVGGVPLLGEKGSALLATAFHMANELTTPLNLTLQAAGSVPSMVRNVGGAVREVYRSYKGLPTLETKLGKEVPPEVPKTEPIVKEPEIVSEAQFAARRSLLAQDQLKAYEAESGGFKVFKEKEIGGEPEVTGFASTAPEWYKDLTRRFGSLKRKQIDEALDAIGKGKKLTPIQEEVEFALRSDRALNRELSSLYRIDVGRAAEIAPPHTYIKGPYKPSPPIAISPLIQGDEAFVKNLEPQVQRRLSQLGADYFKAHPEDLQPGIRFSDQITNMFNLGKIHVPDLQRYGLTADQLGPMYRQSMRDSAQRMQSAAAATRNINFTAEDLEMLMQLRATPEDIKSIGLWRGADNIRRALLVTQLATAVRNFETQIGRVGIDVLQAPLEAMLQKISGAEKVRDPMEGVEQIMGFFSRHKKDVDKILAAFPNEQKRLFATYSSDILQNAGVTGEAMQKGQAVVNVLNTFNRWQEFMVRRAVFQTTLDQELRKQGMDLTKIIAENRVGEIPQAAIEGSVKKAMEATFAEQPKYGTSAYKVIQAINATPATFIVPFPRFMWNSLKFNLEYSPLGLLKVLSPAEREAIANGNMATFSKALTGWGMFLTAYQIRDSGYGGEKWYEINIPKGTPGYENGGVMDMRPYNPFAAYLFVADVIKRKKDGTLFNMTPNDVAMGVLSTNARAGVGLQVLDQTISGLADLNSKEAVIDTLKRFGGEVVGGVLTPINTIKDLVGEFDNHPQVQRDRREEPFMAPIKSRIPGGEETLPVQPSPLRTEPVERLHPGVRQVTGASVRSPKTPVEAEADRLGVEPNRIFKRSKFPDVDREIAARMGPLAEQMVNPLVQADAYKKLKPEIQRMVYIAAIANVREQAVKQLEQDRPDMKAKLKLERGLHEDIRKILRGGGMDVEEKIKAIGAQ